MNLCECFGMNSSDTVRLTQTVQKGGCAAKVAALELRSILAQVKFPPTPSELLIGSGTFDDAAIYRVNDELALVQTLDFFTPIVDSAHLFGRIAAVNALSDVYAMGGVPQTAMAIFAFPLAVLDNSVAVQVLQGASDAIAESGAALVGGHTIDDDTMKFGLSVTGYVHPKKIWSNAKAQVGDSIILTKALGTGTLTAALKRGAVGEADIFDGLESMCQLNNIRTSLSESLLNSVHAATDITGFGFAGHALNLARASQVTLRLDLQSIPRFKRALEFIDSGFLTKAHRTNREYVGANAKFSAECANLASLQQLVFDPQTSGGLLLSVALESAHETLECLQRQFQTAAIVGSVEPASDFLLRFE